MIWISIKEAFKEIWCGLTHSQYHRFDGWNRRTGQHQCYCTKCGIRWELEEH